jgi:hypothetical protein
LDELISAAIFLASHAGDLVTGIMLPLYGGDSIRSPKREVRIERSLLGRAKSISDCIATPNYFLGHPELFG